MSRPLPLALPALLGHAVLERRPDGLYALLGDPPAWFAGTLAERDRAFDVRATFDALGPVLDDAEAGWTEGEILQSGTFVEADASGRARPLFARLLRDDRRVLLVLGPPVHTYGHTQRLVQAARDEALAGDRVRRRIDEREVLLHCIVHDLSNPLQNLRSSLQLLGEDDIEPTEAAEVMALAARQTDRMQAMIGEVLTLFKSEVEALMPLAAGASTDLAAAAREAAAALAPRGEAAGVRVDLDVPDAPAVVTGEASRLARVVGNLLDNALRHSPPGGAVHVRVAVGERTAELCVEDEGPGVAPGEVPGLFTRLRQGRATGLTAPGMAGLGLYFCRITAEAWGGRVEYRPGDEGGARFSVRLPLAAV